MKLRKGSLIKYTGLAMGVASGEMLVTGRIYEVYLRGKAETIIKGGAGKTFRMPNSSVDALFSPAPPGPAMTTRTTPPITLAPAQVKEVMFGMEKLRAKASDCSCGTWAVGGGMHSYWCSMSEQPKRKAVS